MKNKITVIIVTYKTNKRILENCLNSIDRNIKVIIIENSENFDLKEFFTKKYNNIEIYCTGSNTGYGKGNNFGISKVTTQYALILNPDTICNKKFFLNLNKLININSNFHLLGCLYSKKNLENQAGYFNNSKIKKINQFTKVDWVKGFALIINLKKFKNKKIFDENYFLFFEEIDLCKSIKNINGNVYISNQLNVKHLGFKSSTNQKKSVNNQLENLRNWHYLWSNFYYHRKHYGYLYSLQKNLIKLLSSLFKFLLFTILMQSSKRDKFLYRFFGLLNSMTGQPSSFRD
jgi:N-acetylglucosaminyl-diphospho-decaprenol L-rhamnosyltransferase